MKYLRIKVKHLLLVIISVSIFSIMLVSMKGYVLYEVGRFYEDSGDKNKAGVYYDRASTAFPETKGSVYAAKRKIEILLKDKDLQYFRIASIEGFSSSCNGAVVSPYSIEEINGQYERLSGFYKNDKVFAEYELEVALMNFFAGDSSKALKILEGIQYKGDENFEKLKRLHLSAIYMSIGELNKGYAELDAGTKDQYSYIRNDFLRYYYFMIQDYEKFNKVKIENGVKMESNDPLIKPFNPVHNFLESCSNIVKSNNGEVKNENSFTGRVTYGNKPMPYVLVYLKENKSKGMMSSMIGMNDGIKRMAVSDENGNFSMKGVPDGLYGIGIYVEWSRVNGRSVLMNQNYDIKFTGKDKVTEKICFIESAGDLSITAKDKTKLEFNYNPPVKADRYVITIGELRKNENNERVVDTFHSESFKSFPYTLNVEKERKEGMVRVFSYGNDGIDPYIVIDPFYHTGEYACTIYAYDVQGNILYNSRGVFPNKKNDTIHIEGSEWNKADKLLLNKKFEEAIAEYEKLVEKDSNDLHSIKVLASLYYNGWRFDENEHSLLGKDYKKARKYFEMLYEKLENKEFVSSCLADIENSEGNYDKALEYMEKQKEEGGYRYYELARVYGYKGNLGKAEDYYRKYLQSTGYGADIVLMLNVLRDNTDGMLNMAKVYDNRSYYAEYEKMVREYLKTNRIRYKNFYGLVKADKVEEASGILEKEKDDLGKMYKGILVLQKKFNNYNEKEKAFTELYDKVQDKNIKDLMKYFGKAGLNTGFGDN